METQRKRGHQNLFGAASCHGLNCVPQQVCGIPNSPRKLRTWLYLEMGLCGCDQVKVSHTLPSVGLSNRTGVLIRRGKTQTDPQKMEAVTGGGGCKPGIHGAWRKPAARRKGETDSPLDPSEIGQPANTLIPDFRFHNHERRHFCFKPSTLFSVMTAPGDWSRGTASLKESRAGWQLTWVLKRMASTDALGV